MNTSQLDSYDYLFKGIFLFIFVIFGNYLGQLIGCRLIYLLTNNIIIKHLLGFLTLFLTLSFTIDLKTSLVELFKICCILYIIFILSSKTTKYINYILIILFIISFIIQLYKDRIKQKEKNNILTKNEKIHLSYINIYNNYILQIIILLILIGLIIYIGEQKRSYGDDFNYYSFFVGNTTCNDDEKNINEPNEYWTSIKHAFK